MFIKTEDFGIINLNLFQRVDIVSGPGSYYSLTAFEKSDGPSGSDVVIVTFEEKKDAKGALDSLFRCIEDRAKGWDVAMLQSLLGKAPVRISTSANRSRI